MRKYGLMDLTPVIVVYPDDNPREFVDFTTIWTALQDGPNHLRLAIALSSHNVKALVITPEYIESRARDTGRVLLFYFLIDKGQIFDIIRLNMEIEDILGQDALPRIFTREHEVDWPFHLAGLFAEVIEQVFGAWG